MTEPERSLSGDGVNRRTVLKSAAAVGLSGSAFAGAASAEGWNSLEVCAADDEGYFQYEVHVSEAIESDGSTDSGDEVFADGTAARGAAGEGRCDGWKFRGEITHLELDGRGTVSVNGSVVRDTTGDDTAGGGGGEEKELRFQSVDDRLFSYRVSVSGSIRRAPNRDGGDTQVDDRTAEGRARGGNHDDWFFTGDVTELRLDGPGRVLVDGEVIADTTDGGTRTVVVSSPDTDAFLDYSFVVDGDVRKLEPDEDGGDAVDEIVPLDDGRTRVEGNVSTGDDRFEITGPVVERHLPEGVVLEVA